MAVAVKVVKNCLRMYLLVAVKPNNDGILIVPRTLKFSGRWNFVYGLRGKNTGNIRSLDGNQNRIPFDNDIEINDVYLVMCFRNRIDFCRTFQF